MKDRRAAGGCYWSFRMRVKVSAEGKVLVVPPQYGDTAAATSSAALSVSWINEPQAPVRPSGRDSADQYTLKSWPWSTPFMVAADLSRC